jgi:hypothetical protein
MKYLYLVNYWVPFPSSEYGGVVSVIAENDNECHDVLLEWRDDWISENDNRIMENVTKSLKFALANDDESSRVVDSFTT